MAVNPRRPRAARGRCVALKGLVRRRARRGRRVDSVLGPRYSLANGGRVRVGPRSGRAGTAPATPLDGCIVLFDGQPHAATP